MSREDVWGDLGERQERSYAQREDSGRYRNIFLPDVDIQLWKLKDGVHTLDIIPYKSGKNDPGNAPGKSSYVLILFVHRGIGATEDSFVCPRLNYNKPCPICEEAARIKAVPDYDEDELRKLTATKRGYYNVVVYDTPQEEDKGVQVFDVACFYFENKLTAFADKKKQRTGKAVWFAHPEQGMSISFAKSGKGLNTKFESFEFESRDYKISKELLADVYILDDIIKIPTYEELKMAFEEGRALNNEEEPRGRSSRSSGRSRGKAEPEPEQESRSSRSSRRRPPVEEPEPEESRENDDSTAQDEPEPEEPKSTRRSKSKEESAEGNECPGGGIFGKDIEQLSQCDECPVWDDCSKAKEASAGKKRRG